MSLPTIACMVLYKDEIVHLRRIAEKILQIFDQPIFVTNEEGSRDGSELYLQSLGVEPVRIKWQEDFSRARQAGLDVSTCDYTMWMDCDDDLITDQDSWVAASRALKTYLSEHPRGASWHRVYHADRRTFWMRENWFHRDAGVKVRYPTHEVYAWQGEIGEMPAGLLDRVNAPLKPDYGGKHWRYFDMLHKYLKETDRHDCRCRYYLAAEFFGPPSARVALYRDFLTAVEADGKYRNFPEEWCTHYALYELRDHLPATELLHLSREFLLRWPFEFLAHVLHAMISCELEPTPDHARGFYHLLRDPSRYQQCGSGWFRGWYLDRSFNACGFYLHRVAVQRDDVSLGRWAVEILEEGVRRNVVPEVLPNLKGNLEMARRFVERWPAPLRPGREDR